jgi:hypothetical protein
MNEVIMLNMEKFLSLLVKDKGCSLVTGTNPVIGKFFGFKTNESTGITNVYVTPIGGNVSEHKALSDLAGKTLASGMEYTVGYNQKGEKLYIDSITLSSGSVVAYNL